MLSLLAETATGRFFMSFLIAAMPVLELRGAIPIAMAYGVPLGVAIPAAILGNLLPVPFIILFIRKIFTWLRTKNQRLESLVTRMESKAERKSGMVTRYKMLGLCILVAIPLPGTGAWTGALVAAMLNMRISRAFPAIALGVGIAAVIVTYVSLGAGAMVLFAQN